MFLEIYHDVNVRVSFFDRGTNATAKLTEGIGDAVLHAVDCVAGMSDLWRVAFDVNPQAGIHWEKFVPVGFPGLVVEQVIVAGIEAADGAQDI